MDFTLIFCRIDFTGYSLEELVWLILFCKGGLTYVVLEPVLSGFETKNWPALWEAPSSSIFAARQVSLYN